MSSRAKKPTTIKTRRPSVDPQVLTADDFKPKLERVEVPEIVKNGKTGVIYLRPLSPRVAFGLFRDESVRDVLQDKDGNPIDKMVAMLPAFQYIACDENGRQIFSSVEQAGRVLDLSLTLFNRVATILNHAMSSVEADAKNGSTTAQLDNSTASSTILRSAPELSGGSPTPN